MPPRLRATALAGLTGLLLVTACGGGAKENGIDKLSANDALTKVKAAVTKVTTVHVTGHISLSGQTMAMDLRAKSGGGIGTLKVAGGEIDLVRDGDTVYVKGDASALEAAGAPAAQATLIAGKWLKASASQTGGFGEMGALLDTTSLFHNVTTPTGTIATGTRTTVNGKKAFTLVDKASNGNGTLYVSLTGDPLPLRIEQQGSGGGSLTFSYGESFEIKAPSGAVDLSQLSGG